MIKVNALGDVCPIPVVKTKNAIKELQGAGEVETLVDNEIAVQNLTKMANQKGYKVYSEKISSNEYRVVMQINGADQPVQEQPAAGQMAPGPGLLIQGQPTAGQMMPDQSETGRLMSGKKNNAVVVISSNKMGEGSDELGEALLKGFIFALSQQDELPSAMLFYNGGAGMTTCGSPVLEDLKSMEEQGVEILTCGTCLNHYDLTEKLAVGSVTNMYAIAEKMTGASLIVKP